MTEILPPVQPTYSAAAWQARLAVADGTLRVHLIGIGGAGLSAIAGVLLEMGIQVSGSDHNASHLTRELSEAGAHIFPSHHAGNLSGHGQEMTPHVVLASSAIAADNPELVAAREVGIPVVKRDQFLPALLAQRKLIAVAGTHGKSSTTAMIVQILWEAGIHAGYIIGANLPGYGSARAGSDPLFVLEADEYDHMFLGLRPNVAVVTSVEWDHPDCYPTPGSVRRAFLDFVESVPADGLVVSCADEPGAQEVRAYHASEGVQWLTYGLDMDADLRAVNPRPSETGAYITELDWWRGPVGTLQMHVPGLHNLRNGLAALVVACSCHVPMSAAAASLANFRGTARRFELKGVAHEVTVIDDYAHHPTEVRATLQAARSRYPQRRIWAVFQPHTYSRTRCLLTELAASFDQANQVIVTDIFPAREIDDGSVTAADLVSASGHPAMRYVADQDGVVDFLVAQVQPQDVVITLGAGDGYRVGEVLLDRLNSMETDQTLGSKGA